MQEGFRIHQNRRQNTKLLVQLHLDHHHQHLRRNHCRCPHRKFLQHLDWYQHHHHSDHHCNHRQWLHILLRLDSFQSDFHLNHMCPDQHRCSRWWIRDFRPYLNRNYYRYYHKFLRHLDWYQRFHHHNHQQRWHVLLQDYSFQLNPLHSIAIIITIEVVG